MTATQAGQGAGGPQRPLESRQHAQIPPARVSVATQRRSTARQLQYGPPESDAEAQSAGMDSGYGEGDMKTLRHSLALARSGLQDGYEMAEGADAADENQPAAVHPAAPADRRRSGMRGGGAASTVRGLVNPAMILGDGSDAWRPSSGDAGCGGACARRDV